MIKELNVEEFHEFQKKHILSNYSQTTNYGILMSEYGYDYELIGYFENNILRCASLILIKEVKNLKYGYAPKGFLVNYKDAQLLKNFTKTLKDHYYEKEVVFIKINPEIVTGKINNDTKVITRNENVQIEQMLNSLDYVSLKKNLNFESMFPRFNAFISLSEYSSTMINKNARNKIRKAIRKGLAFQKGDLKDLNLLNEFKKNDSFFYTDLYNVYSKTDEVDIFKVVIDYEDYLINAQHFYTKEYDDNQKYNLSMIEKTTTKKINRKMNSDLKLLSYKKDIMEATKLIEKKETEIIAIAIVVKHNNFVRILNSAYKFKYKKFMPNYYLFHNIAKYYSKNFKYLELNGMSGDFTKDSKYYGLNQFKLEFNPDVYEFIGEFDLVVEPKAYNYLLKTNALAKEFMK